MKDHVFKNIETYEIKHLDDHKASILMRNPRELPRRLDN